MDHYLSGAPVLLDAEAERDAAGEEFFEEADAEIVTTIKQLLDTPRAPGGGPGRRRHHLPWLPRRRCLPQHEGLLRGLPSSTATLKHGIENLLRHFVPEVSEVRAV